MSKDIERIISGLPDTPGVYLMKDASGGILYIGKAANLKRRVSSYFARAHDSRIERLVEKIRDIEWRQTDTALEALILEAELIRKHSPPFNVKEKDGKSFLRVLITKEKFPRVLLVRGAQAGGERGMMFGPFVSALSLREALKILRRIFPWSTHSSDCFKVSPSTSLGTSPSVRNLSIRFERSRRACLDYELGLCPGTCIGAADPKEYRANIRNLILFFKGEKRRVIRGLEREMARAAKALEFERAEKIRRQIFALGHIRDTALIGEGEPRTPNAERPALRIEGYDISNISGTSAVGSMVVFSGGEPDKSEYRKFRIRTIRQSDDVGMLKEVLRRRLRNDWPLPHLFLIDGGIGQVNAAREALDEANVHIPTVGIAKGPERKRNDIIGKVPEGITLRTLMRVRDEAHRFAVSYHKKLRGARSLRG